jgi:hypothetical protein
MNFINRETSESPDEIMKRIGIEVGHTKNLCDANPNFTFIASFPPRKKLIIRFPETINQCDRQKILKRDR